MAQVPTAQVPTAQVPTAQVPTVDARASLTDRAYGVLKRRIVTCELEPATKITERRLSAELGLGLTPVREALGRLAGEGLVISMPRQGYLVTPLTVKSVDELFEVWRYVCGALAELAVGKAGDADLERIVAVHLQGRPTGPGDPLRVLAHAEGVFEVFCSVADNHLLADFYRQLSHQMARLFVIAFRDPGHEVRMTVSQDRRLRRLILGRDAAAVREQTMRFNDTVHEYVIAALRSRLAAATA